MSGLSKDLGLLVWTVFLAMILDFDKRLKRYQSTSDTKVIGISFTKQSKTSSFFYDIFYRFSRKVIMCLLRIFTGSTNVDLRKIKSPIKELFEIIGIIY